MYMVKVLYIITSGLSLFFCNGFFLLFHLYQKKKKETSQQSIIANDDFLLCCIGLTIQIGSIHSIARLYAIIFAWHYQGLTCFLINIRVINVQIQLACMFFFTITRFVKLFFPHKFSQINQKLVGILIKILIILIPGYINFVIGHTCGLDIFCLKGFRKSFNLMSDTDISIYDEQIESLVLENFECRTKVGKVIFPVSITIILLVNLCMMVKLLPCPIPPFLTVTPPPPQPLEALELRTVSAMVDQTHSIEENESDNDEESYSVGVVTGILTILVIILTKVALLLTVYHKTSALMSLLMELFMSILVPILWSVTNTSILRMRF